MTGLVLEKSRCTLLTPSNLFVFTFCLQERRRKRGRRLQIKIKRMLQRKFILALSSRLGQYRYLSTQDFISQNDAEFTTKTSIPHTPIFSRNLMEFFRQRQEGPDKHFKILDMTFGSGGHTCYILDQFKRYGVQGTIVVYASDCDTESYNLARRLMSERNYDVKELVPIRSSFKNLEEKLIEKGVEPGTLSGILIGKITLLLKFFRFFFLALFSCRFGREI